MNHYFNNFDKKFIFKLSCYIDKNLPTKRKSKYSSRYYIENILYVLKTGIQWSYLKCDSHYSSVYKKFSYWVNLNIFLKFYTDNLYLYISHQNKHKNYLNDLFIDASHIKNIYGSDIIGMNHYDRYRNSTKCNVIVDQNKIPLSYTFTKGNISDSSQTEILVNKLPILCKDKRISHYLVGDKGYINKDTRIKLKQKKIFLVVPKRKNMKNSQNYSYYQKIKLRDRYKVEHFFNYLDKFRRIILRYDRKFKLFESFNLIAFSFLILKKIL